MRLRWQILRMIPVRLLGSAWRVLAGIGGVVGFGSLVLSAIGAQLNYQNWRETKHEEGELGIELKLMAVGAGTLVRDHRK